MKLPAAVICALWCVVALVCSSLLGAIDGCGDLLWRRGLWAIGVLTPWVFFAVLLGVFVRMMGAKSFTGMPMIAVGFGLGLLVFARKWRTRLSALSPAEPAPGHSQQQRDR